MCWFKKKKKAAVIGAKFHIGQQISFKYRGDMTPGTIYDIKYDENQNIIYDVQIGGECPAVIPYIKETDIIERINRR